MVKIGDYFWSEQRANQQSRLAHLPNDLIEHYLKNMVLMPGEVRKWEGILGQRGTDVVLTSKGELITRDEASIVQFNLISRTKVVLPYEQRYEIRILTSGDQLLLYHPGAHRFHVFDLLTQCEISQWCLPLFYSLVDYTVSGNDLILIIRSGQFNGTRLIRTPPGEYQETVLHEAIQDYQLQPYTNPLLFRHEQITDNFFQWIGFNTLMGLSVMLNLEDLESDRVNNSLAGCGFDPQGGLVLLNDYALVGHSSLELTFIRTQKIISLPSILKYARLLVSPHGPILVYTQSHYLIIQ